MFVGGIWANSEHNLSGFNLFLHILHIESWSEARATKAIICGNILMKDSGETWGFNCLFFFCIVIYFPYVIQKLCLAFHLVQISRKEIQ